MVIDYLETYFDEVESMEFYRYIFPVGSFEEKGKQDNDEHIYNGIMNYVLRDYETNKFIKSVRYVVTDDLQVIRELEERRGEDVLKYQTLTLMNGISYAGDRRKSENAREMYAMIVEIDSLLGEEYPEPQGEDKSNHCGIEHLCYLIEQNFLPAPTFIVSSGSAGGIHLYYVFDKPILLYPDTVKWLRAYRKILIEHMWLDNITSLHDKIQYESLFQSFRMVGSQYKNQTGRVRAFWYGSGEKTNMDKMLDCPCFMDFREKDITVKGKKKISLEKAKEKYPDWYQRIVVEKQPKGTWTCKKDLYEWWKREVEKKYTIGHRYYALLCMSVYAIKCDVTEDELEKDMYDMFAVMKRAEDAITAIDNPLTEFDVDCALQVYRDYAIDPHRYTIDFISDRSGIQIERNKRNGNTLKQHLAICRFKEFEVGDNAEENRRKWEEHKGILTKEQQSRGGSVTKADRVRAWRAKNPTGKKADCIRETGLSKPTVYKWWK